WHCVVLNGVSRYGAALRFAGSPVGSERNHSLAEAVARANQPLLLVSVERAEIDRAVFPRRELDEVEVVAAVRQDVRKGMLSLPMRGIGPGYADGVAAGLGHAKNTIRTGRKENHAVAAPIAGSTGL